MLRNQRVIQTGLFAAICVPFLYFGTQLLASLFYPNYSFRLQVASMLGTTYSTHPAVFNTGAILTGIAAMAGAFGLFASLHGRSPQLLRGLAGLSVFVNGVLSVKAGLFPLPDHRHASWGFLMPFVIATPLLLLLALWRYPEMKGRGSTA